jgi:class 3 adenylate cyclase
VSRRLIVTEFMTLDGVIEAPGSEEHRDGRNAWALRLQSPETEAFIRAQYDRIDTFLLGRTTYQIWAAYWPTESDDNPFAQRMNAATKYVVSSRLSQGSWANTTVLGTDWPERVADIKQQDGGDILVTGSADLVNGLLEHELVDELQLLLFPVVLGTGKRLFREGVDTHHMELVETRSFPTGVVLLVYRPHAEAPASRYVDQYAWTDEQVRAFQAEENVNRVLATVLFTDIVGSSERAAAVGDRRWRQLLDRHDQTVGTEIKRWHGQLIKLTGDGILATFDAPTRALRCALGIQQALRPLDLSIRAGIHTGEIEIREGDVGGIAVHIAARALAEGRDQAVVVTRTVRDLASGADLVFQPLGSVELRGIPGSWELFEASLATKLTAS